MTRSDEHSEASHRGTPRPEDDATGIIAWLIRVSTLATVVAFIGALLGRLIVVAIAATMFVIGVVAVGVLTERSARRRGKPFGRSLHDGVRAALGWAVDYL